VLCVRVSVCVHHHSTTDPFPYETSLKTTRFSRYRMLCCASVQPRLSRLIILRKRAAAGAKLIDGKAIAADVTAALKTEVTSLKAQGVVPGTCVRLGLCVCVCV